MVGGVRDRFSSLVGIGNGGADRFSSGCTGAGTIVGVVGGGHKERFCEEWFGFTCCCEE